ncbi:hypothetical protein J3Q64DRAFT_1746973 [Phycomyces blakesleeanus]|uniref:SET domain-containing protein n=2 Tax=Phycomyces blakesleeanus TaxID=4837 RepID=A0A162N9H9_PHYB8|nr:hypothetical protein PHYBLDRAFT_134258 [Phycomyces blakesleeanus NRRL 1555(-)]OAD72358.1 hypothetical protein PHYBLDRAFT_134258 [Phycomyces blakesleeanus NRRL 1555(-)]|eukprot:XP_018290398.1 hypothetical protein PHYBLDRAFT_134258 [Phycomyces blakesleeanus NRRL 1555(-)]
MSKEQSHPGLFKVIHRKGSFSSQLIAEKDFKAGETIADLTGLTPGPKRYSSVQVSCTEHVELNSDLLYLNHACDPTTYLDVDRFAIVALVDIKAGDELNFFYPSTEWEMAQPFECWCGSSKCIRLVSGASSVNRKKLEKFKLSKHIQTLLDERDG